MLKKLIAMAAALMIAASFAGCGSTEDTEKTDSSSKKTAEKETESSEAEAVHYDSEQLKEMIGFKMLSTISFNDDTEIETGWQCETTEDGDLIQFDMTISGQMINDALAAAGKSLEDIEFIYLGVGVDCPDELISTDTMVYSIGYAMKYDVLFEADGGDTRWSYSSEDEFKDCFITTGQRDTIGMPLYSDPNNIDTFTASYTVDRSNLSLKVFDINAFFAGEAAFEGEGEGEVNIGF